MNSPRNPPLMLEAVNLGFSHEVEGQRGGKIQAVRSTRGHSWGQGSGIQSSFCTGCEDKWCGPSAWRDPVEKLHPASDRFCGRRARILLCHSATGSNKQALHRQCHTSTIYETMWLHIWTIKCSLSDRMCQDIRLRHIALAAFNLHVITFAFLCLMRNISYKYPTQLQEIRTDWMETQYL